MYDVPLPSDTLGANQRLPEVDKSFTRAASFRWPRRKVKTVNLYVFAVIFSTFLKIDTQTNISFRFNAVFIYHFLTHRC